MAIQFKEHTSFLSTNNKNKIKVGELNCPIAAVNRERKVLVTQEQVEQAADQDFSSITLTPPVVLMNEIPEKMETHGIGAKHMCSLKSQQRNHLVR